MAQAQAGLLGPTQCVMDNPEAQESFQTGEAGPQPETSGATSGGSTHAQVNFCRCRYSADFGPPASAPRHNRPEITSTPSISISCRRSTRKIADFRIARLTLAGIPDKR